MADASATRAGAARQSGLVWRIISAAILAPVTIAAVMAGGPIFAALVAFCAVVMVFEWTRMVEGRDFTPAFYGVAFISIASMVAAAAGYYPWAYALAGGAALVGGALSFGSSGRPAWVAFGAAYVVAPSIALVWLRTALENGEALALMLYFIVWAADSGGYFGGRLVGGPKLNPAISPAKTWAGAVGGVILGAIAGFASSHVLFAGESPALYSLAGGSLGLASILGDTAESAFKRSFGVKDMSGFIPGHGGFLDRLDGMIFATTAMTLVLFLHMIVGGQG